VRHVRAAYIDFRLFLTGKTDPDLPPLRLRDIGGGDFREMGQHLLGLTSTFGSIGPASSVLDIGCGTGRLALPLSRWITTGEYAGFDVSAPSIRWCQRNITPRHPRFSFRHVALRNSDYSSVGGDAARLVFPYPDAHFDCAAAYSVFTHLMFDEMANYLRQAHRVLKPGGRLVATFFLLNPASESAIAAVAGVQQFPHERGRVRIASEGNPALAVAIREETLLDLLREIGFRDVRIETGTWFGRQGGPTFQDLVTCQR
jgi:SAM-dependent methyltransferase